MDKQPRVDTMDYAVFWVFGVMVYMMCAMLSHILLQETFQIGKRYKPSWLAVLTVFTPGINTICAITFIVLKLVNWLIVNVPPFLRHAPEWFFGNPVDSSSGSSVPETLWNAIGGCTHDWDHVRNVKSDQEKEALGGMLSLWQCRKCKHFRGRGTMEYTCTPGNFYNDDEGNVEGGERDYGLIPPIPVEKFYYEPTTNQA